jgi:hypothetical protein
VLAVLAYAAGPGLTVRVGGGGLVFGASVLVGAALGLPLPAALAIGLLAGAAFLLLPLGDLAQRIAVSTALAGAALALHGLGLLFLPDSAALGGLRTPLLVLNWLALGALGLSAQLGRSVLPVPLLGDRAARAAR